MTKPQLGDMKVDITPLGKEFSVQVSVFKQNTLRGDAYWVSKVFRKFKTESQANKFAQRFA